MGPSTDVGVENPQRMSGSGSEPNPLDLDSADEACSSFLPLTLSLTLQPFHSHTGDDDWSRELPSFPPPLSFLSLARCERISAISPFFSVTFFSHMLSLHRSHKKESSSTTRGACPVPHSMDGSVVLTRGAALPGRHGVAHQQSASSVVQAGQECARLLTHPSREKA